VVIARSLALPALAPLLALALVFGGVSGSVAGSTTPTARHACQLLTRAEIESVLGAAPLDPGPTKRTLPNVRKRFTNCRWDDEREATSPQLAVFTTLARNLNPSRLAPLAVAADGTATRNLTSEELGSMGARGTVEILRDGTYGSVAIVRGRDAFLVSAAYQGPAPLPQVTEADMIALARLAAARV